MQNSPPPHHKHITIHLNVEQFSLKTGDWQKDSKTTKAVRKSHTKKLKNKEKEEACGVLAELIIMGETGVYLNK